MRSKGWARRFPLLARRLTRPRLHGGVGGAVLATAQDHLHGLGAGRRANRASPIVPIVPAVEGFHRWGG